MSRTRSAAAAKLTDAAPVFAALGDPTRLGLVARLSADGPLSIAQLSEDAGVTRQAITKHQLWSADRLLRDSAKRVAGDPSRDPDPRFPPKGIPFGPKRG